MRQIILSTLFGLVFMWQTNGIAQISCPIRLVDSRQSINLIDGNDVEIGDFDGDGDLDVFLLNPFVISSTGTRPDRILLNDGQGNMTPTDQLISNGVGIGAELGDLDGDGDLDVILSTYPNPFIAVSRLTNLGNGQFANPVPFPVFGESLDLGDYNQDGDLDLLVASGASSNYGRETTSFRIILNN